MAKKKVGKKISGNRFSLNRKESVFIVAFVIIASLAGAGYYTFSKNLSGASNLTYVNDPSSYDHINSDFYYVQKTWNAFMNNGGITACKGDICATSISPTTWNSFKQQVTQLYVDSKEMNSSTRDQTILSTSSLLLASVNSATEAKTQPSGATMQFSPFTYAVINGYTNLIDNRIGLLNYKSNLLNSANAWYETTKSSGLICDNKNQVCGFQTTKNISGFVSNLGNFYVKYHLYGPPNVKRIVSNPVGIVTDEFVKEDQVIQSIWTSTNSTVKNMNYVIASPSQIYSLNNYFNQIPAQFSILDDLHSRQVISIPWINMFGSHNIKCDFNAKTCNSTGLPSSEWKSVISALNIGSILNYTTDKATITNLLSKMNSVSTSSAKVTGLTPSAYWDIQNTFGLLTSQTPKPINEK